MFIGADGTLRSETLLIISLGHCVSSTAVLFVIDVLCSISAISDAFV